MLVDVVVVENGGAKKGSPTGGPFVFVNASRLCGHNSRTATDANISAKGVHRLRIYREFDLVRTNLSTGDRGRRSRVAVACASWNSMNVRALSVFRIATAALGAPLVCVAIRALGAQEVLPVPVRAPADTVVGMNGWFVGGSFGYSQGRTHFALADPARGGSSNALGYSLGGLHAGYSAFLSSKLLIGAEADVSFPDFFEDGVVSSRTMAPGRVVTEKIDLVSTLRGRLGYATGRWLMYGTGGFALSEPRFFESGAGGGDSDQVLRFRSGWVVGAGAEFAMSLSWAARVEYSYDQLGRVAVIFPSGAGVESQSNMHSLQLGLSHKIGWPRADAPKPERGASGTADSIRWNIHGQDTFIEQGYFKFRSPYEGTNSLTGASQAKNTESATAFLGVRLWQAAALYFDPEVDQGSGLDATHGVSAFPNGEAQKAVFPMPRFVVDRLFLRQTFGLGGERESFVDGPNQIAGESDISRITVVVGRLAVTDYFDDNAYANDPRTNFLNWNAYGAGAFDWTMDQISWTWGALAELNQKNWAVRAGYFLLPIVSSNNSFDTHIPGRGEYALEWEWRYSLLSRRGKLRVFGWVNHGTMGSYAAALALPATTPNYPDITLTRQVRSNPGMVVNVEQQLTDDIGLFSRASWSPGRVEILGGTDCSESLSVGAVLKGSSWGRHNDRIGVSGILGGLSPIARAYFAAGGTGILIGDGALNYRVEQVAEAYYSYSAAKWLALSLDYQFVVNPGYNADRGPVSIYAVRVHAAF
jgi:high affinity Mn2+ porin